MSAIDTQVLAVEDDNIVAMELRDRLESMGYGVSGVIAYGEQAIGQAKETRPDLVLMDIRLRGEMDGIQAAEAIRTDLDIPVIYLTANADEPTLQRAKQTEPYGFIIKPFQERELHTAIQMALYKHKMESRLRERERWSATTLQSISDGVITTDRHGIVEYMNPVAEELTGWQRHEAVGRDVAEVCCVVDEGTGEEVPSPVNEIIRCGIVVSRRTHLLMTVGGDTRPIKESWAPICDGTNNIMGIVLAFHDISAQQQAEHALRQSNGELANLLSFSALIANPLSADTLLQDITRFITDTLPGAEAVSLWLYDHEKEEMVLRAWTGLDRSAVSGLVVPAGSGLMGLVCRGRQPYNIEDVTRESDIGLMGWPPFDRVRSALMVPLLMESQLIGVLSAYSFSRPHAFQGNDLRLLSSMAGQAAIAIDRARLLEMVTHHQRDLQRLSAQLVQIQEEERKRISQELHDEIGQALTAVGINLSVLMKALTPEHTADIQARLTEAIDLTDQTLEQMRELSIELRPAMLDDLGLTPTLRWYLDRFARRLGIEVSFRATKPDQRLSAEMETALYRVVQEAMTNVARHAQATHVRLRLMCEASAVTLLVEDDGQGFDVQKVRDVGAANHGIGLFGIRERVELLGGQFEVHSRPGYGTRLCVEVPL